jgi:hypothetical protein
MIRAARREEDGCERRCRGIESRMTASEEIDI